MSPRPPEPLGKRRRRKHLAKGVALLLLAIVVVRVAWAPRPLARDAVELSRFTRSSNALGLDVYAEARIAKGNVAVSPLAISNALVVLWLGARGETRAEIQRTLHAEGTAEAAIDTAGEIAKSLADPTRKLTYRSVDRLFVERRRAVESTYLERTRRTFGALVEPADFASAPERSRQAINDWVAGQTENHIRELVPPGAVDPTTTLVLASAIYLRARWKSTFSKESTWPEPFYRTPADIIDVPMMHQKGSLRAAWLDGVGVLELPYEDSDLAMILVLPTGGGTLPQVEARLSASTLDRWIAALEPERLAVCLPRFEIVAKLPLSEPLKALGMALAFDPNRADLTAIAGSGVFVREISHEVYLRVDEEGTEAAAGTRSSWSKASPGEFRADQPFLFLIREVRSGLILFMGRISDPTAP